MLQIYCKGQWAFKDVCKESASAFSSLNKSLMTISDKGILFKWRCPPTPHGGWRVSLQICVLEHSLLQISLIVCNLLWNSRSLPLTVSFNSLKSFSFCPFLQRIFLICLYPGEGLSQHYFTNLLKGIRWIDYFHTLQILLFFIP